MKYLENQLNTNFEEKDTFEEGVKLFGKCFWDPVKSQLRKRHFGFQYRNQAMAFQIVYIDQAAWNKRHYRERLTGENCRKVQRMLHLFLFDEIHVSRTQRLQIVRDMMLEHEPANELA